jgi:hypothetical protein
MNDDVRGLIFDYVYEFEALEHLLRAYHYRYCRFVLWRFQDRDDIDEFEDMLRKPLTPSLFRFSGGCTRCQHPERNVVWTQLDNYVRNIRDLLAFVEHMRSKGKLCPHECVKEIREYNTVVHIKLASIK